MPANFVIGSSSVRGLCGLADEVRTILILVLAGLPFKAWLVSEEADVAVGDKRDDGCANVFIAPLFKGAKSSSSFAKYFRFSAENLPNFDGSRTTSFAAKIALASAAPGDLCPLRIASLVWDVDAILQRLF